MRSALGTLGLAALVCAPCLLVLGGGALVASGALTLAVVRDPAVQALALLALVGGAVFGWRYVARRRSCEADRAVISGPPDGGVPDPGVVHGARPPRA